MRHILFAFCLLCAFTACTKDDKEILPAALQEIIDNNNCICEPYIKEYRWRGQKVYLLGSTGPACNWMPVYYDAQGNIITMETGYWLSHFDAEATYTRLIWKCGSGNG